LGRVLSATKPFTLPLNGIGVGYFKERFKLGPKHLCTWWVGWHLIEKRFDRKAVRLG